MRNRESLLGRSRPGERLSKQDREALDQQVHQPPPPPSPPTPPASKKEAPPTEESSNAGKEARIKKDTLKFHWTTNCPACGFKIGGSGDPQRGQRLARCGRCKINLFLGGK